MYICTKCKQLVKAKTKCFRTVVETREKEYPLRPKIYFGYTIRGGEKVRSYRWRDRRDDPGGKGREISQEANLCPECASKALEK